MYFNHVARGNINLVRYVYLYINIYITGRVGSVWVGSGRVGTGWFWLGRFGSLSGWVGSGAVRLGCVR